MLPGIVEGDTQLRRTATSAAPGRRSPRARYRRPPARARAAARSRPPLQRDQHAARGRAALWDRRPDGRGKRHRGPARCLGLRGQAFSPRSSHVAGRPRRPGGPPRQTRSPATATCFAAGANSAVPLTRRWPPSIMASLLAPTDQEMAEAAAPSRPRARRSADSGRCPSSLDSRQLGKDPAPARSAPPVDASAANSSGVRA